MKEKFFLFTFLYKNMTHTKINRTSLSISILVMILTQFSLYFTYFSLFRNASGIPIKYFFVVIREHVKKNK